MVNHQIKYWATLFIVLPFCSCLTIKQNQSKSITNELYIYHNGIDTLVKDYNHYNWIKPLMEEQGLHFSDTTQNWTPKIGESSKFIYYQIIDRKYVFKQYSIFFDSTVILSFKKGLSISDNIRQLTPFAKTDSIYTDVQNIMNNSESLVETYIFSQDSLLVKTEFISNRETPIHIAKSWKFGQLTTLNTNLDSLSGVTK
jgi:hypothetical protein